MPLSFDRSALAPAPGRGQYDRALTRAERQAEQRDRLAHAAAQAFASGPLTIARIVTLAGVGRNTFYEYFDDPEHALALVEAQALRALAARTRDELADARTPISKLRALCRAWFAELALQPSSFRVALRSPLVWTSSTLSPAGRFLAETLEGLLDESRRSSGLAALPTSAYRIIAVAAAAEAFSRALLAGSEPDRHEAELADVMTKLLR